MLFKNIRSLCNIKITATTQASRDITIQYIMLENRKLKN
jgi:hypothetical protein